MPAGDQESLEVTQPGGGTIDLGPLIMATREMRRHALHGAEQEKITALDSTNLAMILTGIRFAITELFGRDAAKMFMERVISIPPEDPE